MQFPAITRTIAGAEEFDEVTCLVRVLEATFQCCLLVPHRDRFKEDPAAVQGMEGVIPVYDIPDKVLVCIRVFLLQHLDCLVCRQVEYGMDREPVHELEREVVYLVGWPVRVDIHANGCTDRGLVSPRQPDKPVLEQVIKRNKDSRVCLVRLVEDDHPPVLRVGQGTQPERCGIPCLSLLLLPETAVGEEV